MEQDETIVHTFNSDIEAELKKKDASMLKMATSNASHIEPTDPPDYKSIIIAFASFALLISIIYFSWKYYKNIIYKETQVIDPITVSTSTPATLNISSLQIIMPNSGDALYPYISLLEHADNYMLYKVHHYNGLIGAAINSEPYMISDLQKYFKDKSIYDGFVDSSVNNIDLRIATSISTSTASTFIYGIVNREYMIISTDTVTWFNIYNKIIHP